MTTYGYPDTCYTTHQKPHLYADLCQRVKEAWENIDFITDACLDKGDPLPYIELEMRLDEVRELQHRKAQAYKAWCNGDDPELEELEF